MYEPTSDNRIFAKNMFDMFQALTQEGFTEGQAIAIIGQTFAAVISVYKDNGNE